MKLSVGTHVVDPLQDYYSLALKYIRAPHSCVAGYTGGLPAASHSFTKTGDGVAADLNLNKPFLSLLCLLRLLLVFFSSCPFAEAKCKYSLKATSVYRRSLLISVSKYG